MIENKVVAFESYTAAPHHIWYILAFTVNFQ